MFVWYIRIFTSHMQILKRIFIQYNLQIFTFPRREAPMPPLEGEVVERQRNRRGLCVTEQCEKTPQSAYGCQLPFQGRPWQNR